jgi:FkbM family methyltransferase
VAIARIVKSVVGYEANPGTFRLLEMNVKINNLENVTLFNKAVGDRAGKIEFLASRLNPGGSKIKPKTDRFLYHYDNPEHLVVDMVSLDEHCPREFDMIVMDIEGAEFLALKGMQHALRRCKHLKLEYVPHHLENVSGVSNEEFLSAFSQHFTSVREEGSRGREHSGPDILDLLNSLRRHGRSAELIFSK